MSTVTPAQVALVASQAVGRPYVYGGGAPTTPYPKGSKGVGGVGVGYDCTGYMLGVLVALGLYSFVGADISAATVWSTWDECPEGTPGSARCYGSGGVCSHVLVEGGDGRAWGANGGGKTTDGGDPEAKVQEVATATYWRSAYMGNRKPPAMDSVGEALAAALFRPYLLARQSGLTAAAAAQQVGRAFNAAFPPLAPFWARLSAWVGW